MASRGVNKVILVGNVGGDPETRYMPNGSAVANITLATTQSWKDKNTGEQKEVVEWHRLVFFSRLAEIVGEYVKKGAKLYIEGSLRTRSWEQDGIKRYATEIVAAEMQMLDTKATQHEGQAYHQGTPSGSSSRSAPASEQRAPHAAPSPYADDMLSEFDDDIPF